MRTKGMEGNEAHGQRLYLIFHLQQFFLAQIINAQFGSSDMNNLSVVKLYPQLLGQDFGQFPPASAVLATDGDNRIFHYESPLTCLENDVNVFLNRKK